MACKMSDAADSLECAELRRRYFTTSGTSWEVDVDPLLGKQIIDDVKCILDFSLASVTVYPSTTPSK
jgi:hypothetical protein